MKLEFEKYVKTIYEIVDAAELPEDMEVQLDPRFSKKTLFPKGSYLIQKKNGQQELQLSEYFKRDYIKIQENTA